VSVLCLTSKSLQFNVVFGNVDWCLFAWCLVVVVV
jgi:hypothetical protein